MRTGSHNTPMQFCHTESCPKDPPEFVEGLYRMVVSASMLYSFSTQNRS